MGVRQRARRDDSTRKDESSAGDQSCSMVFLFGLTYCLDLYESLNFDCVSGLLGKNGNTTASKKEV